MSVYRVEWMMVLVLAFAGGCGTVQKSRRIKYADSVTPYPGDGGAVISNLRYAKADEVKTICVAPPPQAGANVNTVVKHKGKVNVLEYVEVESDNSVEYARTLMKLHENNERTLFLQFSLYRLCEAYMNGMLDRETYAEVLERRASEAMEHQRVKSTAAQSAITAAAASPATDTLTRPLDAAKARHEAALKRDQLFVHFSSKGIGSIEELKITTKLEAADQAKKAVVLELDTKAEGKPVATIAAEIGQIQGRQQQAQQAISAGKQAEAELKAIDKEVTYLVDLAKDARTVENKLRADLEGKTADERERGLQSLTRKNYMSLFGQIMQTAENLAQTQVELARAEAEKAKAEAEKAKADAAKAASNDASKKLEEELKQLKGLLIEATVKRISGSEDTKTTETRSETTTETKK